MKTKEQILETALGSHHVSGLVEEGGRIWRAILEAMEDYRNLQSGEGVKPPESYLQGMESVYSPTSIGANYSESDVIKALTAQARDYEREILAFKEFYSNTENYQVSADKHLWNTDEGTVTTTELLTQFRNDRSKPKDHEIEHECATCHKDISKWGFCPDCDTQANSR